MTAMSDSTESRMSPPKTVPDNLVTAENAIQAPADAPPKTVPDNLVTAENAIQAPADAPATAGAVVKKGAPPPEAAAPRKDGLCVVRITKTGHGQVHTGDDDPAGKKFYDWNDEVCLPASVGKALESRSFGEVIG